MLTRKWRSALAVTSAGVALALAGCSTGVTKAPGPNGPTVASLITSMKAGFAHANSVRIDGTGTISGKAVTLNVGMFRSGDMAGDITEGPLDGNVVVSSGKLYFYVSKKFFSYLHTTESVPMSACKVMCGKYVATTNTFGSFTLAALSKQFEAGVPVVSSVPRIRVTTYHGQPAYELSDAKGRQVFLAKNGTHYMLGIVDPGQLRLSFSEWNAVPPVTAPPVSKIFKA
jgi:hypothetical protein